MMTGRQLARAQEQAGLTDAALARLAGYTEGNVRALKRRQQLPAHAEKLMGYVLREVAAGAATAAGEQ